MERCIDLYQDYGSYKRTRFGGKSLFSTVSCVGGKLACVCYDESNRTGSSDLVMAARYICGCVISTEAAGSYLDAECTVIAEASYSSDNDGLGGYGDIPGSDECYL